MSIEAALHHRTRYEYDRRVQLHPQLIRLRPAPHARTQILSYSLKVEPADHFINWQQDPFGNFQARLVFPEKTTVFDVTVDLVAKMEAINPFDFFVEEDAFYAPFSYEPDLKQDLKPYLQRGASGEHFGREVEYARSLYFSKIGVEEEDGLRTIDFLVEINQYIYGLINYTIRMEPGVQTPEETLSLRSGSCRDSTWLLVSLLRELGLAARFVSGYLIQLKADEVLTDVPNGPAEDFTDLHAWAEVYIPGAGWVGLDPTSGLFAGEGHIPLAATPQPSTAAPIAGGVEPCKAELDFTMSVRRIHETPRVSKPLTDENIAEIDRAGQAIDGLLIANDVRLTMGGEPTFIADSDRDADEWNTDAVGPTKAHYADRLIRRLRDRFAPHGFLHYGQGKWYPGESLPRWAYALYWRDDDLQSWSDPSLIAPADGAGTATAQDADAFCDLLARNLEIDPDFIEPAFEDPAEFMLREQNLAPNVDPINNKLDDPEERSRLARVFERGLGTPAAFVLPIQLQQVQAARTNSRHRRFRWRSEKWNTRRGRLYLKPGDSPSGFRLPLQALAYLQKRLRYVHYPLDPFAPREPLPIREPRWQDRTVPFGQIEQSGPLAWHQEEIDWVPTVEGIWESQDATPGGYFVATPNVRTALTVESRNGVLCVFMPPTPNADAYMDLVQAVEETAQALSMPIHLEGYPPPDDYRLNVIKVTPDPGVIEVNVHPAATWKEQTQITRVLYEEAAQCGLVASKFQLDGRPTGSGGGAHVVVGGQTPSDSPFLRRPDVLGSIIRYWQHHPSLSYLFAGMFVGPTSQAPRIDEARQNSLYELEIALEQIPDPGKALGGECPPWFVDRLLRNLLIDVAGNTHRAEICIDKLYSPDGPAGRLGLVEFRAFEMPPHAEMNLAQQLLIRALIAWFWKHPYTKPLKRLGTALHDRFMLPYYLWADFEEILSEVSAGLGVTLRPEWFKAQFEFRFPFYGRIEASDIALSLRGALEPWPVLGEENAGGGTARFVDSSVERLEVTVTGDLADRYEILCQGYRLPLQSTPRPGQHIAGVRFRTWWPTSCLHPHIAPHTPLIFDIYDRQNGRAVGGCTYYSTHPGGRNFETQPINGLEAEGRRRARFDPFGHHAGEFSPISPIVSEEFPVTLDLMRQAAL